MIPLFASLHVKHALSNPVYTAAQIQHLTVGSFLNLHDSVITLIETLPHFKPTY
jgi:hypothetical protein